MIARVVGMVVSTLIALVVGWYLAEACRFVYRAASSDAPPVPHVQSDCRAACTLEGMALAGIELVPGSTTGHRVACLCAPIESSPGGDL